MRGSISHETETFLRRHSIARLDQYQYAVVLQQTYSSKKQTNRKLLACGAQPDINVDPTICNLYCGMTRRRRAHLPEQEISLVSSVT